VGGWVGVSCLKKIEIPTNKKIIERKLQARVKEMEEQLNRYNDEMMRR
jgi:hypothetical protein